MGEPIWLCFIVPNTVYGQFQEKSFWVVDKRVEVDGIGLDTGDIDLKIQWYESIPVISISGLVYRFYCDNPPQVQIHTQPVHVKISMTKCFGAAERRTSARNKSPSPTELLHGYYLQWKLNGGKEFYNKIAEEVVS